MSTSMALQTVILDFDGSAASLTIGASSVNVAIPANSELVALSATGNAHFHFGDGNATAATTSDPVITPNSGMLIVRFPPAGTGQTKYLAVIQDGSSTGVINICRVKEG